MIVYLDSSVLAHAYLADEPGHDAVESLLADAEIGLITGTWSRIEVSGALVRAARSGQGDGRRLLALLDADLAPDGRVSVIAVGQDEVEERALRFVREHALRAMDAWHLAVATQALPDLAEPGEETAFATRDATQAAAAEAVGLRRFDWAP